MHLVTVCCSDVEDVDAMLYVDIQYSSYPLPTVGLVVMQQEITIRNTDRSLHKVFELFPSRLGYPNISLNIRRFDGFNDGGCASGGVLFGLFTESKEFKSVFSGPFCSFSYLNQPFFGHKGLNHTVLGRQILFIVYAYSPLYHVDFDLILSGSECEGILEPVYMCPFNAFHPHYVESKYPNV